MRPISTSLADGIKYYLKFTVLGGTTLSAANAGPSFSHGVEKSIEKNAANNQKSSVTSVIADGCSYMVSNSIKLTRNTVLFPAIFAHNQLTQVNSAPTITPESTSPGLGSGQ